MASVEVLAAADQNLVEAWRGLTSTTPAPGETSDTEIVMLSSGLPVPLFNPTIVTGPVADPAATVRRIVDHYAPRGLPFLIWCRDEVTGGLAAACASAGLVEHWRPPLMVLDPVPAVLPPVPEGLAIEVAAATTVADHASVLSAGFGMPRQLVDAIVAPGLADLPGFSFLVGRVNGEPVTTAAALVTGDLVGIYNVATAPAVRGRGYGAAMTWSAVGVGRDAGAVCAVLQASEQGAPVYERMGFTTPTRYRQFEPA